MTPKKFAPGQRLSAADLTAFSQEQNRQSKINTTPPLTLSDGPNGYQLAFIEPAMWALVTPYTGGSSSSSSSAASSSSSGSPGTPDKTRYTIKEAHLNAKGKFVEMVNGRQGVGYELNDNAVPSGSAVRAHPGREDNEWEFSYGGTGAAGGGFNARVAASELSGGLVIYEIEELEIDPSTFMPRVKEGGRTGPAYRMPTEELDPPPIPVNQGVWAVESLTVANAYEITPWGGRFRQTKERLVDVEGEAIPAPTDCGQIQISILKFYETERIAADGLCATYAAAGEGGSPA